MLYVDAHLFIQALDPSIGFLGFRTKATTETSGNTIPFNRHRDKLRELLNDGLQCSRYGLNNGNEARHIQRRCIDFVVKFIDSRGCRACAGIDGAKARFDGRHLLGQRPELGCQERNLVGKRINGFSIKTLCNLAELFERVHYGTQSTRFDSRKRSDCRYHLFYLRSNPVEINVAKPPQRLGEFFEAVRQSCNRTNAP